MRKILLIVFVGIFLLSFTSAAQDSLGNFALGEDVLLVQTCADCTYNNITFITFPNSSELSGINDIAMTQSGSKFTYNLDGGNTTIFGCYDVNGIGDIGGTAQVWVYPFCITPNGEELPGDNFNIFLYTSFILLLFLSLYCMVINLAKLASVSETVFGLSFSWGVYFSILLMYYVVMTYSTSLFLRDNIIWVVGAFGFTNFFIPLISLFIAFFIRGTQKKKPISIQDLTGRKFLGYGQ